MLTKTWHLLFSNYSNNLPRPSNITIICRHVGVVHSWGGQFFCQCHTHRVCPKLCQFHWTQQSIVGSWKLGQSHNGMYNELSCWNQTGTWALVGEVTFTTTSVKKMLVNIGQWDLDYIKPSRPAPKIGAGRYENLVTETYILIADWHNNIIVLGHASRNGNLTLSNYQHPSSVLKRWRSNSAGKFDNFCWVCVTSQVKKAVLCKARTWSWQIKLTINLEGMLAPNYTPLSSTT